MGKKKDNQRVVAQYSGVASFLIEEEAEFDLDEEF